MVFLVAVFFFRKQSFRVDGDTVSVFWKSCIALPDEMASASADRAHETATGELQDQTIAVNGELSLTCVDEDSRNDLEQAKKTCGAKKVSDLNGIAIASQTCHSPLGNENHFDSSNESKYERSITSVTYLEEKQICEQAGPADPCDKNLNFSFVSYESERQMSAIMALITKDLSEPYSIYTYRYFIHNWPKLCFLVSCKRYLITWIMMITVIMIMMASLPLRSLFSCVHWQTRLVWETQFFLGIWKNQS